MAPKKTCTFIYLYHIQSLFQTGQNYTVECNSTVSQDEDYAAMRSTEESDERWCCPEGYRCSNNDHEMNVYADMYEYDLFLYALDLFRYPCFRVANDASGGLWSLRHKCGHTEHVSCIRRDMHNACAVDPMRVPRRRTDISSPWTCITSSVGSDYTLR